MSADVASLSAVSILAQSGGQPQGLIQEGQRLYETGQFSQAAELLQQAIQTYQAQGDTLNQALALRNLALVYRQLGQWSAATEAVASSLQLLETLPSPERLPVLARTLDIQGSLSLDQGQPDQALNSWEAAANIYQQLGDETRLVRNQLTQAQALQAMGMYRRAIATLTNITQTLQDQPDSPPKAVSLQLLGNALQVAGDLDQATASLQESLAIAQRLQLPETISAAQVGLGNTARAQGNPEQALSYYRQAASQAASPLVTVQAQLNQLSLLIETQQWPQAEALAANLQQPVNALPLSQDAVYAQINLADNCLKLAQKSSGSPAGGTTRLPAAPPSAPITTYTRDNLDLVDIFLGRNAAQLPAAGTAPESAAPAVSEAAGTYTRDNLDLVELFLGGRTSAPPVSGSDPESTVPGPATPIDADTYTRNNVDLVDLFLGGPSNSSPTPSTGAAPTGPAARAPIAAATLTDIARSLSLAQQNARQLNDQRAESYALGSLGSVYEQAQQWSEASALTQKALLLAQTLDAPEIAYRWQWQLGRILKAESVGKGVAAKEYQASVAAYSEAVNTLQTLRSDLVAINPEVQVAFQESVEPVHRELVNLLLTDGNSAPPENLEKARKVIESLQLAELDNFFREACLDASPVLIDQIDRQAAVFYPIILPDRLEVILRLPGQPLRHYRTSVSQTQVEATVAQLRQALVQKSSQRFLPFSQQLYDWLIRPVAADLASSEVQTLVFVSDGVLRNIPMAALHDGQQFLMETYAVALTPGLQLLAADPISRKNLSVLIAGLSEARQGFTALPNVEPEVEQIEATLPSRKVLLNQDFTELAFADAIRNLDSPVVHLATHGQFSSNLEDTFILTWNDRLGVNQLRGLLQTTGLDQVGSGVVELLVLSACETAVGDRQAALGLAGTAVRSGARSTLGSLWQVNDEATALFISRFYQELAGGQVTKAEALRRAQLAILENPQFRQHPYFWAPYIMVGNWL
jgi:CHAT domain-containing protein